MTEPISVQKAIMACEKIVALCDAAESGPYKLIVRSPGNWARLCWVTMTARSLDMPTTEGQLLVAARATLKPLAEYVLYRLKTFYFPPDEYPEVLGASRDVACTDVMYTPVAAHVGRLCSLKRN